MSDRLLVDTHVVLWWRANDPRLTLSAREAIAAAKIVFVSAASAWEIAIKSALGRVRLPRPFSEGVQESGFIELPIGFQHADAVEFLPPHHADPFDRMLLAQAKVERLVLVTHDRSFEPYGHPIVWT
ncbi:MAG: type II toxin-antitoxin system VapC family toxin [Gemmatimonadaceae bacterium]|nr:type II toxin-antitoxin system VapC family toxin [Gemmatimonadaceae bacterium]